MEGLSLSNSTLGTSKGVLADASYHDPGAIVNHGWSPVKARMMKDPSGLKMVVVSATKSDQGLFWYRGSQEHPDLLI